MSLLCGFCVFLYLIGNLKGQLFLHVIIKISLNLHKKALFYQYLFCLFILHTVLYCTSIHHFFSCFLFLFLFRVDYTVHSTQYYTVHMSTVHSTQYNTVHMSTVSAFCLGSSLSLTVYCMACLFICSPSFCLSVLLCAKFSIRLCLHVCLPNLQYVRLSV